MSTIASAQSEGAHGGKPSSCHYVTRGDHDPVTYDHGRSNAESFV